MKKFNIILYMLILALAFFIAGAIWMQRGTVIVDNRENIERIDLMISYLTDTRISFLEFYINEYCEETTKMISYDYNGSVFQGLYCNKSTVMLLDGLPPLPIYIIKIDNIFNNEDTHGNFN